MKIKRFIGLFLSVVMAISLVPADVSILGLGSKSVLAEEATVQMGTCGTYATWELDNETGILTISGSGTVDNSTKFNQYENIKSVVIGSSITSIDDNVFRGCKNLVNVKFSAAVTTLGEYVFEGCIALESISVPANNRNFCSESGVLFNEEKTKLVLYPAGKTATSYSIPDGVTAMENGAFDYNQYLKTLSIPASLVSLGDAAPFYEAKAFEEFSVNDSNEYYSSLNGSLYNKDKTKLIKYAMAQTASTVETEDTVTIIGEEAFSNSDSLTEVTIGTGVKTVEYGTFTNCMNLTKITILNPECVVDDMVYSFSDRNENLTIYGYAGSTAEAFANLQEINFVAIDEKEVESISVATMPKKTIFALGDSFNSVGLEINIKYTDGTSVVRTSGFTLEGFDSSTLGKNTITVAYGDATTSYEVEIVEELEIPSVTVGEKTTVDIIEENQLHYFYFTPDVSGTYNFYASSNSDTYGAIYDSDGNLLVENDDKGDAENEGYVIDFYISYDMEAGKTYLLATKFQMEDELGTFDIVVERDGEVEEPVTYSVKVDGEEVATVEEGETYTLPTTAKVGYYGDGQLYKKGSTYTVTKDIDFYSVGITAGKGASIKWSEPSGIRFSASLTCEDTDFYDTSVVKTGMLIAPYDLYAEDGTFDFSSTYVFLNVENSGWAGTTGSYGGALASILPDNYRRYYIGRAYVTVKYADNSTATVYSNMTQPRSVAGVAETMLNTESIYSNLTTAQKALLEKYVS